MPEGLTEDRAGNKSGIKGKQYTIDEGATRQVSGGVYISPDTSTATAVFSVGIARPTALSG